MFPLAAKIGNITLFPEASHSIIKVFVKSGIVKTGARHIASLRCSKALVASGVHENALSSIILLEVLLFSGNS